MTITIAMCLAAALAYWFICRPLFLGWGTCEAERRYPMTGDDAVAYPRYQATLGITIDAPPTQVWPWLVQMGYRRGGLYSYDCLDRLFGHLDRPSSDCVLPEYQQIAVGEVIPVGRGNGFPVKVVQPNQALVLGDETNNGAWAWAFVLSPIAEGKTRLRSRGRVRAPRTIGGRLFMLGLEPAAFLMTRKMLFGIKRRAEKLAEMEQLRSARAARHLAHRWNMRAH